MRTSALALLALCAAGAHGVTRETMLAWQDGARAEVAQETAAQLAALEKVRGAIDISDEEYERLKGVFSDSYQFSIQKTLRIFPEDNSTFITTGDIGQMWLRDSTSQLNSYLNLVIKLAKANPGASDLQKVFESAMDRQISFINSDVYSSAFYDVHGDATNQGPTKNQCPMSGNCPSCTCTSDQCNPKCGDYTYQRNFELDSLLNVLMLHMQYWKGAGVTSHIDNPRFRKAVEQIIDVCEVEQDHNTRSPYRFPEGYGRLVKDGIGLVWSYARPSDDKIVGGYSIPDNMMVVAVLAKTVPMLRAINIPDDVVQRYITLTQRVEAAIEAYGVIKRANGEKIYAFEADGFGYQSASDDANMPNLLWIPYLGYEDHLQLYNNTRRFSLSAGNGNYFSGAVAQGLGSQHQSHGLRSHNPGPECRDRCIWHLGLIMDGFTTPDRDHKLYVLHEILGSLAGQTLLHEGFSADNAAAYNRDWFGWADAMFANWVRQDWIEHLNRAQAGPTGPSHH